MLETLLLIAVAFYVLDFTAYVILAWKSGG